MSYKEKIRDICTNPDNITGAPYFNQDRYKAMIEGYELKHTEVNKLALADVSTRSHMRKRAICVFELTKGFVGEPTDNAMKIALEMAGYVMQLTDVC